MFFFLFANTDGSKAVQVRVKMIIAIDLEDIQAFDIVIFSFALVETTGNVQNTLSTSLYTRAYVARRLVSARLVVTASLRSSSFLLWSEKTHYGWTDRWTDTPSNRVAYSQLKTPRPDTTSIHLMLRYTHRGLLFRTFLIEAPSDARIKAEEFAFFTQERKLDEECSRTSKSEIWANFEKTR